MRGFEIPHTGLTLAPTGVDLRFGMTLLVLFAYLSFRYVVRRVVEGFARKNLIIRGFRDPSSLRSVGMTGSRFDLAYIELTLNIIIKVHSAPLV